MSDETKEVDEDECVEVRIDKKVSLMDPDGEFSDPGKKQKTG